MRAYQHPTRREIIAAAGLAALASPLMAQPDATPVLGAPGAKPDLTARDLGWDTEKGEYILPALPYDKAALEPHIDAKTMETHHSKHHQAYVDGANKALKQLASIRDGGDAGLVKHWSRELSFHLGGHINHTLFWRCMAPSGKGGGGSPGKAVSEVLARDFGSYEKFVAHFKAAALQVEGGGWAWLVYEPFAKRCLIVQMEKQQDMMPVNCRPLLGIDVWEHAYYLTYTNRRGAYLDAWFNLVNWAFVDRMLVAATARVPGMP